jgi:hypothetical protein
MEKQEFRAVEPQPEMTQHLQDEIDMDEAVTVVLSRIEIELSLSREL